MRWMGCLALVVMGCTKGEDPDTSSDTDTDADSDTDTDTDTDTDSDTDSDTDTDLECESNPDAGGPLHGEVWTETDAAAECVRVQWCASTCVPSTVGEAGDYYFGAIDPGPHALEATVSSYPGYATSMTVYDLTGEDVDVQMWILPLESQASIPGTPTEMEVGNGLHITIGGTQGELDEGADIEVAFGANPDALGGVAVPADKRLPYPEGWNVAAAWYVSPFDTKLATGAAFRIENTWGAENGTQWTVLVPSYGEYEWKTIGTYVMTDGEISGTGIEVLTSVVVIEAADEK